MKKNRIFLACILITCIVLVFPSLGNTNDRKPTDKRTSAQRQFDRNLKPRRIPNKSLVHRQFNFHIVEPDLWRSSQPNDEALPLMKRFGLKTIVNLTAEPNLIKWEGAQAKKLNIRFYSFPMDASRPPDNEKLQQIVDIVADPNNRPVLVHCRAGKDRTGLIIALYKIRHTNESFNDIYKEMIMYGFDDDKYHEITKTVKAWYMTYRK